MSGGSIEICDMVARRGGFSGVRIADVTGAWACSPGTTEPRDPRTAPSRASRSPPRTR